MIRGIRNAFTKPREEADFRIELAMVVDGHRLYRYVTVDDMPVLRENVVRIGYAKMELGVKTSDLRVYLSMVREAVNENRISDIATMTDFLDMHLEDYGSERIALEIGGYGVLVDDEPHDEITDKHIAIKEKLVRHQAVRDFFLSENVRLVTALVPSIEGSLLMESLTNPGRMQREIQFLKLISQDAFKGLWTTVTPPPSGWQKMVASITRNKS